MAQQMPVLHSNSDRYRELFSKVLHSAEVHLISRGPANSHIPQSYTSINPAPKRQHSRARVVLLCWLACGSVNR